MKLQPNKPAAHWSTDFVEHVRTVHFSLVAACFGLLVLVQTKPKDLITAREQLQSIQRVICKWDDHWVDSLIESDTEHRMQPPEQNSFKSHFIQVSTQGQERFYALYPYQFDQRAQQRWRARYGNTQTDVAGIAYKAWLQAPPKTLEDFRERWDQVSAGLPLLRVDTFVLQQGIIVSEQRPWKWELIPIRDAPCPNQRCFTATLRQLSPEQQEQSMVSAAAKQTADFAYTDRFSDRQLVIPVRASPLFVKPQDMFFLQSKPENSSYGSFSEVFGALDEVTTGRQKTLLADLDMQLKDELALAKSESLQVFGITIPAAIAAFWGTLTILALQIYLWVHLYELAPKLKPRDPGSNIAWIGLYQSQRARLLFKVSSIFFPVLTIAFVAWKTEFRLLLRSRLSESLIAFLLQTNLYFWFFLFALLTSFVLGSYIVSLVSRYGRDVLVHHTRRSLGRG